jgi:hypothetical protein
MEGGFIGGADDEFDVDKIHERHSAVRGPAKASMT